MIKTILIDDEPLALAELQDMLTQHTEIEVVAIAQNPSDAISLIQKFDPDLLLLDINMPDKNGLELLEELDRVPEVIFITAHDQYAIKAFELNALDYLLKPIRPQRLADALHKVTKLLPNEQPLNANQKIFVKEGEHCYFIRLSEISFLESMGNYSRLSWKGKKVMLHRSLNYLENRLPSELFFRASRQYIINTEFIKTIIPHFNNTLHVVLQSGDKIELSQRQSARFRQFMGI